MIFLYIDPGAGSMVIQAVLAGILAIPFIFRTRASQIVQRFRRQVDDEYEDGPQD